MRYRRNKGGVYAAGAGLLGLLVTVAIVIWLFTESASVSVNSYNTGKDSLNKALELGEQVANQAYQRNRDPSQASPENAGTSNHDLGVTPVAPGIVTPPVTDPPAAIPPAKTITKDVPLQMPDHGANKLIEDME